MDRDDLGMIGQAGDAAVDDEISEGAAEGLQLIVVELLVAEEDHLMLGDGRAQFLDLPAGERLGDVDAGDLGADAQGERSHFDGLVSHRQVHPVSFPPHLFAIGQAGCPGYSLSTLIVRMHPSPPIGRRRHSAY